MTKQIALEKRLNPSLYVLPLLVLISVCCPLYYGMRLFGVEPLAPYICLNSTPSDDDIVHTLRYGPVGVSDDGLTYLFTRRSCPYWGGVGTPKVLMQLQVKSGDTVLTEGEMLIGIVSDEHLEIFRYTPYEPISPRIRGANPALQVFLTHYAH